MNQVPFELYCNLCRTIEPAQAFRSCAHACCPVKKEFQAQAAAMPHSTRGGGNYVSPILSALAAHPVPRPIPFVKRDLMRTAVPRPRVTDDHLNAPGAESPAIVNEVGTEVIRVNPDVAAALKGLDRQNEHQGINASM